MKNKKSLILSSLITLLSIQFVIAASGDAFDRFTEALLSIFGFIIGNISDTELLVIKALVFVLLLAIIHFSLKKTNLFDNNATTAIVSIIVSLIAIRFIKEETLVKFIWLPYGGLGVLIGAILPFIIFFFFIESLDTKPIRVVGWVSFMTIYFMLAYMKWNEFIVGPEWWQNLAWAYIVIAIVSLLVLLFEKGIRKSMVMRAIEDGYITNNAVLKTDLQKRIEKLTESLAYATKSEGKKIEDSINRIKSQIRRMSY